MLKSCIYTLLPLQTDLVNILALNDVLQVPHSPLRRRSLRVVENAVNNATNSYDELDARPSHG